MYFITRFYLRKFRPVFLGLLTRFFYNSKYILIGKNFKCDSIPKIIVTDKACIRILDNVTFGRNVEIRCHINSKVEIHNHARIDRGVRLLSTNSAKIEIGEYSRIGLYSVLNGGDSITLSRNVLVSGFVYLQTSMHKYEVTNIPVIAQGYVHDSIFLSSDVWLGAHTTILPGVKIGKSSIVGSNSVVTKNVADYMVVVGSPARSINVRK